MACLDNCCQDYMFAQIIERTALSPEPSSMLLGRRLTAEILQDNCKPIALYYSNDDLAVGGLLHCMSQGGSARRCSHHWL